MYLLVYANIFTTTLVAKQAESCNRYDLQSILALTKLVGHFLSETTDALANGTPQLSLAMLFRAISIIQHNTTHHKANSTCFHSFTPQHVLTAYQRLISSTQHCNRFRPDDSHKSRIRLRSNCAAGPSFCTPPSSELL